MRLEQLEYFLDIAKTKSMNITAERKFITQPSLSEAMRKLEEELGCELFIRSKKGVELTPSGLIAQKWAETILADVDKFKEEIRRSTEKVPCEELEGTLNIGAKALIYNLLLPDIVMQFAKDYPKVKINIFQIREDEKESFLKEGIIDFALMNYYEQNYLKLDSSNCNEKSDFDDMLTKEDFMTERLCIIAHKDLVLGKNKTVTLNDVMHYPIVMFSEYQHIKNNIIKILGDQYENVEFASIGTNLSVIRDIILNKNGIGFSTEMAYKKMFLTDQTTGNDIKVWNLKEKIYVSYYIIKLKNKESSALEETFIEYIKRYGKEK